MWKRIRNLLVVIVCCGVAFLLLGGCPTIVWVGSTDLTVEFVVRDAETGAPVEGAAIDIVSFGGFYDEARRLRERGQKTEEFRLTTDAEGLASYVCWGTMCSGRENRLRFTDTFAAHLPNWFISVSAPGYLPNEVFELDSSPRHRAQRTGPQQSKVVVPIALRKAQP